VGAIDPADLSRRIGVCFSAGDLRRLAEGLGVDDAVAWDRGTSAAARDLVRVFERKNNLRALLAKLREVRPLVEWPEPEEAAPSAEGGGGGGDLAFAPPALAGPGYLVGSEPVAADASDAAATAGLEPIFAPVDQASPPPIPPLVPPPIPPSTPPAATVIEPASVTSSRAPLSAASPSGRAPGAAWPGMIETPKAEGRGIDPRLLILVPALTLLAAIVAYFAGRAGTPSSETPATAATGSPTSAAEAGGDVFSNTPGGRVAEAISRSLSNVARACEIPLRGPATEDILVRAFDQCGPPVAPPRSIPDPSPPRSAQSDADPQAGGRAAPAGGAADRPGPRAPVVPKAPALPTDTGPAAACMNSCQSEHNTCKGRCGKEPAQSSLYEAYQACLGRCLSTASKCRLQCK